MFGEIIELEGESTSLLRSSVINGRPNPNLKIRTKLFPPVTMETQGMTKNHDDSDKVTIEMTRKTRRLFHLKYLELGFRSYEECIRKEILGIPT